MNLLELRSVSFGYGSLRVINTVSISVDEGEMLGVIGPNGAGKTTLFRLMSGLSAPWEGSVLFKGTAISAIDRRELARAMATMPQSVVQPFPFSVKDFVSLGRFPHRGRWNPLTSHDRAVIDQSLQATDTAVLQGRLISELSGGERQRVLLAQALAQEPRLLLLDEPTAHLDIGHQSSLLDLVGRLNRTTGVTVVMVLHDLNCASEFCSRLVLLDKGSIKQAGTPQEVLTYQNIESVYQTVVVVKDNPVSHKPHVFPVSPERLQQQQRSR